MDTNEFDMFVNEIIPCSLFHIEPTDIDKQSGARLDELILINTLFTHPQLLAYKPLTWFIEHFITSNDKFYDK